MLSKETKNYQDFTVCEFLITVNIKEINYIYPATFLSVYQKVS